MPIRYKHSWFLFFDINNYDSIKSAMREIGGIVKDYIWDTEEGMTDAEIIEIERSRGADEGMTDSEVLYSFNRGRWGGIVDFLSNISAEEYEESDEHNNIQRHMMNTPHLFEGTWEEYETSEVYIDEDNDDLAPSTPRRISA